MGLLSVIFTEIERLHNHRFLEAAMAVCALCARASGRVTLPERYQIDAIVATLERLKVFEPRDAIEMLDEDLFRLREDPDEAVATLASRIRHFAGDAEATSVLVRIAYMVITADDRIDDREGAMFDEICALLGVSPGEARADLATHEA